MGTGFKIPIVLILVGVIFLFGCTGSGQTTGTATPGAKPPATTPTGPGTPSGTPPSTTPTTPGPGTVDIGTAAFSVLLSGNIPVHCVVTYQNNPPMDIYMRGAQKYRAEIRNDQAGDLGNTCAKMVVISNGDKTYLGCIEGSMFSGLDCQWLEIPKNETEMSPMGATTGQYDAENLAAMKDLKTSCGPWAFDESKFSPPVGAKTCTLESLTRGIIPPPN